MTRVAGVTAAVSAALLMATACNSDGADVGGAELSATPNADPAVIASLMLGKAELPSGYQLVQVPKDQAQQFADTMGVSTRNAKITPSKCKHLSVYPADVAADQVGSTVAMKTSSILVETVAAVDGKVDEVRQRADGECSTLTIEVTEGSASGAKATTTSKVLDGPKTAADAAVVVQQSSTVELAGSTTRTAVVLGLAEVNGYLVSVQTSDTAGNSPDLAAFNAFFAKAIGRVSEKTS
ncbi:hypothetical protein [Gordonia hydrophobica]|uniref:DUF5642 domain-containing protein n=1 Tax=Gordonia hydrophobica TaxID=40516 RepID=A0ABZ2U503_9ACTN|nr:hypothetical protein [Gordonia hydrophobica]MBM7369496.1 hypothetical protein [Gordonia hydrophobica]